MKSWIRRNLVSGVVVVAPVAVTLYVILWVYRRIAALPGAKLFEVTGVPLIDDLLKVVVSIFIIVFLLAGIGSLVRTALGVILQRQVDRIANRIPGLRLVYNATKMGIETLLGETEEFNRPVKIEIGDLRFTAFKTGNVTDDGRETIFLPTSPNITTGFVIEVDDEWLEETDEDVEDALTRILSAGFGMSNNEKERREGE